MLSGPILTHPTGCKNRSEVERRVYTKVGYRRSVCKTQDGIVLQTAIEVTSRVNYLRLFLDDEAKEPDLHFRQGL